MYNETYHPVDADTLNWMLVGEPAEYQKIIKDEVVKATEGKIRNFVIELPDGSNYVITNGIIQASKRYARK